MYFGEPYNEYKFSVILHNKMSNERFIIQHAKLVCYTSQLKYVSWLEENVSRANGQNSMTP